MFDQQQILNVRLNESVSLDNFVMANNQQLLLSLTELAKSSESKMMYIWGESGVGKTHLLHGVCHLASRQKKSIAYIPMSLSEITVDYLQALEHVSLICVDDMHEIVGKSDWEQAYFHLYNRIRERGHSLLLSANVPPRGLSIGLEDLRSRLSWGLVYQIQPLDDAGSILALKRQAQQRGFELPDKVARYLLNRHPRDNHSLFSILDKLDTASLTAQRKITIPFVRDLDL